MEDSDSTNDSRCCGLNCCKKNRDSGGITPHLNVVHSPETKLVFSGDLPQPLLPGHCIIVTGSPLEDCTRFSINFTCGKGQDTDIAFHFNPRLELRYIVRNSRINGHWGAEETTSCYKFDLPRKKVFKIAFFIAPREFMVSVNKVNFCSFVYRIPAARIKCIEVHGDVQIDLVDTTELSQYPEEISKDLLHQVPFGDYDAADKILPSPFIGHLPKGIQSGWQLEIFGRVKILPHSFYVNLQEGNQYWPHPIIPLHLNLRFNTLISAHSLIRNGWINGSWGIEERSPSFHFCPGRNFHLIIRLEYDCFSVWVDGRLDGEFKLRMTSNQIDTVYIQGDLILYKVFINDKIANMVMESKHMR